MERRVFIPLPPPRSARDWPNDADAVMGAVAHHVTRRRRRYIVRIVASATVAACVLWIAWRLAAPEPRVPVASAIVSVPNRERLPDGTVVELNGAARIRADFSASLRRVELLSGEAHFTVATDPLRPFVVVAGNIEVRALGTEFCVQLGRAVEVIVTRGSVAVERASMADIDAPPPGRLALVEAGKRMRVEPAVLDTAGEVPPVVTVSADELAERLAWRAPRLDFAHAKLSDVVALFNAHGRERLVLGDHALGELRLTGLVRTDDTIPLLQLLRAEYGLEARRGLAGELVIVRAK